MISADDKRDAQRPLIMKRYQDINYFLFAFWAMKSESFLYHSSRTKTYEKKTKWLEFRKLKSKRYIRYKHTAESFWLVLTFPLDFMPKARPQGQEV